MSIIQRLAKDLSCNSMIRGGYAVNQKQGPNLVFKEYRRAKLKFCPAAFLFVYCEAVFEA